MLALLATAAQSSPYQIRLSSLVVQFVVGAAIPLAVGLVTKMTAHPGVKAVLLLVFTAVSSLLIQSTMNDGVAVISKQASVLFFMGIVTAIASHFGVWKPTTVSARLLPTVGIGGPVPARQPTV